MRNGNAAAEHERACAQVARRYGELWLRVYVGRKLRSDPIFATAFGLLGESRETLIDIGCGVGLLPFYLRERGFRSPIVGIDRDGRKIARAQESARRAGYRDLEFIEENVTEISERCGNIVLFDLLHYLPPDQQARLLERLVPRVAPGGMLIIRDCPRDGNARFWLTHLAERFAQTTTWNVGGPLHFPSREKICAPFSPNEFSRNVAPLWGRTPFNNHLFVFHRHAQVATPAGA